MSRLSTSFILGYHGCDQKVAKAVVAGKSDIKPSQNDFDWLGHGSYFWESDPSRAMEYAEWKVSRREFETAAVIGAVIDLRNCLDLTNRRDLELVKFAFNIYTLNQNSMKLPMAKNKPANGDVTGELLLRYLDCAVINVLHYLNDNSKTNENFDTVRGMFTEGGPLYEGAGFQVKTHTQVAVRNPRCIKGYFLPRKD